MASKIPCASCGARVSLERDLLARRFQFDAVHRRLPVPDILQLAIEPIPDATEEMLLHPDYSTAMHAFLLSCSGCLAITRTDRPAATNDVVPGRISLAVPGAFVVRAVRRLESASAGGRVGRELRTLAADPVRRYAARVPAVFRAARAGFGDALMLTADVVTAYGEPRHAGPQGLVWDDGPRVAEGRQRLRRLVRRAEPVFARSFSVLPYLRGQVSVWHRRYHDGFVIRLGRGTRLPILGEDGAAFHVGPPRVQFDEHREQMRWETLLPAGGFVLPLDLAVPA